MLNQYRDKISNLTFPVANSTQILSFKIDFSYIRYSLSIISDRIL